MAVHFRLLSDLHLDAAPGLLAACLPLQLMEPGMSECLVLAGNIGRPDHPAYAAALRAFAADFQLVVVVAGPTELVAAAATVNTTTELRGREAIAAACAPCENIAFLDRGVVVHRGIRIVGGGEVGCGNDGGSGGGAGSSGGGGGGGGGGGPFDPTWFDWLESEAMLARAANQPLVIVTATPPVAGNKTVKVAVGVPNDALGGGPEAASSAPGTPCTTRTHTRTWLAGDARRARRVRVRGTEVVTNPLGYWGEGQRCGCEPDLVVEVEVKVGGENEEEKEGEEEKEERENVGVVAAGTLEARATTTAATKSTVDVEQLAERGMMGSGGGGGGGSDSGSGGGGELRRTSAKEDSEPHAHQPWPHEPHEPQEPRPKLRPCDANANANDADAADAADADDDDDDAPPLTRPSQRDLIAPLPEPPSAVTVIRRKTLEQLRPDYNTLFSTHAVVRGAVGDTASSVLAVDGDGKARVLYPYVGEENGERKKRREEEGEETKEIRRGKKKTKKRHDQR